jgi:hypothetical protein
VGRSPRVWFVLLLPCIGGSGCARPVGHASEGCPDDAPPACHAQGAETLDVGICQAGVPRCEGGVVVECVGEVLPEVEWCNGKDDDCDGQSDEGVCRHTCVGLDCERAWGEPPTGFVFGRRGGIALELSDDDPVAVLWVPEENSGTLAKVDTRARRVLARYQIVRPGDGCPPNGERPDNIAVDPDGNAYVGTTPSFDGDSVESRIISVAYGNCPDRDGDGTVETSSGPLDILPFMEDECVRWQAPYVVHPRRTHTSVAVERRARGEGPGWLVWVGADGFERVWALDPETGEETGDVLFLDEGTGMRWLDFDARGVLFASGLGNDQLVMIDTATLTYSNGDPPLLPSPTVLFQDHLGRIWFGDHLTGYDSALDEWISPSAHELVLGPPSVPSAVTAPSGVVYGETRHHLDGSESGQNSLFTYDIESDDMQVHLDTVVPESSYALDRDGMVWQVEQTHFGSELGLACAAVRTPSNAWVLDPWTGERELAIDGELWGTMASADNPTGVYPLDVLPGPRWAVWTLQGCHPEDDGKTVWRGLDWESTGDETHILFDVQAGDDQSWSADRSWTRVGQHPEDQGPVTLRRAIPDAHPFLHVRATLSGDQRTPPFRSPELLRISASYGCPDDVD